VLIFSDTDCGKGYGSEAIACVEHHAFATMRLHKIYVRVLVSNEASQVKWTRRGYAREGVMREEYLVDPAKRRYEDMISFGKFAPSS
jgi:diamine N-acetyltransferase